MAVDVKTSAQTAAQAPAAPRGRPNRLHHAAWITLDSEATRHFYEDVLGIPLVATWSEQSGQSEYVHTFYAMEDGSALAFFEYADKATRPLDQRSPGHLAFECTAETQSRIVERLAAGGVEAQVTDHGYCRSVYVRDPNNLLLEFTVDHPDAATINARQAEGCHDALARWLAGDHTPNNDIRAHGA
ncbi:MAG: VOC family protein [Actinomycetota bacterium]|nr:VOC family protein [Actinomycetota bacterium]